MRDGLEKRCRDFLAARDTIKEHFRMEFSQLYPVCANIFCARGIPADENTLERCKQLLKQNTGVFSNFRGTVKLPSICMLAADDAPEALWQRTLENYAMLKERFFASEYLALASLLLARMPSDEPLEERVARGRALYKRMRKEHPLLTGSEDSIFCLLLAYSPQEDGALIAETEAIYTWLKERFHDSNAVQTASHVLSLYPGAPREKADRMIALYDALRAEDVVYGRSHPLAVLATLAMQAEDLPAAARDVRDVSEWLRGQKGYGFFGADKRTRAMHAAMIESDECSPSVGSDAAIVGSALAIIAAQQAAMCAMIASSSAATAAASSGQ